MCRRVIWRICADCTVHAISHLRIDGCFSFQLSPKLYFVKPEWIRFLFVSTKSFKMKKKNVQNIRVNPLPGLENSFSRLSYALLVSEHCRDSCRLWRIIFYRLFRCCLSVNLYIWQLHIREICPFCFMRNIPNSFFFSEGKSRICDVFLWHKL